VSLLLSILKKNNHLNDVHLTIVSVGSRKLNPEDDFASNIWSPFIPNLSIYGFDADADACHAANTELEARGINWQERHIPLALSKDVGEATLYVTKAPFCSSLYPPNEPYLARFANLLELMSQDFTLTFNTTTLDQACQAEAIPAVDFLQIDVQGADLHVLEGATLTVANGVLAVQTEVEFAPLYVGQPLFADLDHYLRAQGFTLFELATTHQPRARSPISSAANSGQVLWGDAFYFRDLLAESDDSPLKTPANLLKLACIADALDFPDYALELLEYLTLHYGNDSTYNVANSIVETLAQVPALVEHGLNNFPIVMSIQDYVSGNVRHYLTETSSPVE
jgi:FkbM family methyltransferase